MFDLRVVRRQRGLELVETWDSELLCTVLFVHPGKPRLGAGSPCFWALIRMCPSEDNP